MGGSSVGFQTPIPLYEAENSIFGQLPWSYTGSQAQNAAYSGIGNLSNFLGGAPSTNMLNAWAANAGAAGNTLSGLAPGAVSSGQSVYNTVSPYISQALTQGFDPQSALYNKLFQQQQDQSNAENAMAGVATTPYGAALTNQGDQNFNLAWNQQQLQNQATAANTASQLAGTGLGGLSTGANIASSLLGAGSSAIGGAASTQEGLQTQQFNAQQQQLQDYINYILGSTQNSAAYTNAVNASTNAGAASTSSLAQAQQAGNSGKSGIGSALGGIGSLVGGLIP